VVCCAKISPPHPTMPYLLLEGWRPRSVILNCFIVGEYSNNGRKDTSQTPAMMHQQIPPMQHMCCVVCVGVRTRMCANTSAQNGINMSCTMIEHAIHMLERLSFDGNYAYNRELKGLKMRCCDLPCHHRRLHDTVWALKKSSMSQNVNHHRLMLDT
jgi:hypothetical protein